MLLGLEEDWLDDFFDTTIEMMPVEDYRKVSPTCYLCEKEFDEKDIRVRGKSKH